MRSGGGRGGAEGEGPDGAFSLRWLAKSENVGAHECCGFEFVGAHEFVKCCGTVPSQAGFHTCDGYLSRDMLAQAVFSLVIARARADTVALWPFTPPAQTQPTPTAARATAPPAPVCPAPYLLSPGGCARHSRGLLRAPFTRPTRTTHSPRRGTLRGPPGPRIASPAPRPRAPRRRAGLMAATWR